MKEINLPAEPPALPPYVSIIYSAPQALPKELLNGKKVGLVILLKNGTLIKPPGLAHEGVGVIVGVTVTVGVIVGVTVTVGVIVGVTVTVGVIVGVTVIVGVGVTLVDGTGVGVGVGITFTDVDGVGVGLDTLSTCVLT